MWHKKGQSGDTGILFGIIALLIILAVILPIVKQEFEPSNSIESHDTKGITNDLSNSGIWGGIFTAFNILFKILIWNVDTPFWTEAIYITPMRILGYYIFIRLARGV